MKEKRKTKRLGKEKEKKCINHAMPKKPSILQAKQLS
jgi:hypothetical protein